MKIMALMNTKGEGETLITDIKHRCINVINKEHNCGYDRAETTVVCLLNELQILLKEKEIL